MRFGWAHVKSVKADLHSGEITIAFTVPLNDQKAAEILGHMVGNGEPTVVVTVEPRQAEMWVRFPPGAPTNFITSS